MKASPGGGLCQGVGGSLQQNGWYEKVGGPDQLEDGHKITWAEPWKVEPHFFKFLALGS